MSDTKKFDMKKFGKEIMERDAWPYGAYRYMGERHMSFAPYYWISRDETRVRVVITNIHGEEISRPVVIDWEAFASRPKPDRMTGPEAHWAFSLCGFTPR